MSNPSVYLSGPITGLTYSECNDWREYAIKTLAAEGIDGFSPMRGKRYLDKEGVPISDCPDLKGKHPISSTPAITMRDRWDCRRCDITLINVLGAETVSVGSMVEAGWAEAFGHPVILVMENEGNPHDRAILRGVAGVILPTLDQGLNAIIGFLKT